MGIQRINIDQQLSAIGIRSNLGGISIEKPQGQLTINNERPQLTIDTQLPSFRINTQKLRADLNLHAPLQFSQQFRDEGRQTAVRATGQFKSDGNYLGNYQVPAEDRVPSLAKNKAMSRLGPKEVNIGLMPPSPPELNWDKGQVNVDFSPHKLEIDFNGANTAQVSLDPQSSVEIYLRQRAYFSVSVVDAVSPGRYIDSTI